MTLRRTCEYLCLLSIAASITHALPASARKMLCIAHRGFSAAHHENSLQAIAAAWRAGADVVEIDVRKLKDHTVVLFHDKEIDGVDIAGLTYAELQTRTPKHHVPTLQEALAKGPRNRTMLLDLKDSRSGFLKTIVRAIGNPDLVQSNIIVQSTNLAGLKYLRAETQGKTPLFYVTSLEREGKTLSPPDAGALASMLVKAGLNGITAKGRRFVNREYVRTFQKKGLRYFVWTINDPSRMRHYESLGVDGIITDDPRTLIKMLKSGPETPSTARQK